MNETPTKFEQALSQALQRVDAPPTLLRFLTAAVEVEAERKLPRRERTHRWVWFTARPWQLAGMCTALAAMVVLGVVTGEQLHARHERERVQLADRQFDTAVRVTGHALDQTRAQLLRAGIRLSD